MATDAPSFATVVAPAREKVIQCFVACIVVSVLAGIHTTVVFTLVSIYAKTALGRNLDSGYVEFLVRARCERKASSFITALGSFSISVPARRVPQDARPRGLDRAVLLHGGRARHDPRLAQNHPARVRSVPSRGPSS